MSVVRCEWAGEDPLYQRYHDEEWGVPIHDERTLFEFLVLEGAQAGLSWITILKKREGYREAFAEFDPERVARFRKPRIEKLLTNTGIVRNRLKVESTVTNAKAFLAVQGRIRRIRPVHLGLHRRQTSQELLEEPGRGARQDAGVRRHVEGAQTAGLQIRRLDDLLCLHAGGRHGRRPRDRLLSLRQGVRGKRSPRPRRGGTTKPSPPWGSQTHPRLFLGRPPGSGAPFGRFSVPGQHRMTSHNRRTE